MKGKMIGILVLTLMIGSAFAAASAQVTEEKPNIEGPENGEVGKYYTFTVTDIGWLSGSDLEYLFGWQVDLSNGCFKNLTTGNLACNELLVGMETDGWSSSNSVKIAWEHPGNYLVCAKVGKKIEHEKISMYNRSNISYYHYYQYTDWGVHNITITNTSFETGINVEKDEPQITSIQGGRGVKVTIQPDERPVDWAIDITGELVFGATKSTGEIAKGSTETVKTDFLFGFGNVDITVTANSKTENYNAFLLGSFMLNLREA